MNLDEIDVEMTVSGSYGQESAVTFNEELEDALRHRPHYRRVYDAMNLTFRRFLNERTNGTRIIFAGDFAKTDYVLKQCAAPPWMVRAVHDTRVRLRKRAELSVEELERHCQEDWQNLSWLMGGLPPAGPPLAPSKRDSLKEGEGRGRPAGVADCLRAIVERWDDVYVYVLVDGDPDGGERKVCYARGNRNYDYDWGYLRELFYRGAQLNLVCPRVVREGTGKAVRGGAGTSEHEAVLYPELIIFEPDYLVNISTVARCFTNYADSPLVDLIKRLEPQQATDATVLGNLAGQMLDEAIRRQAAADNPQAAAAASPPRYEDSVRAFFKDNAVSLLTIGGGASFHEEARRQQAHIAQAVGTLASDVSRSFNAREGILEASFYSEMLGLQGRMDYFQTDFRLLVEQKSGKGAFPYDRFVRPRQTEEHYVQMLLYAALVRYNYREVYERIRGDFHAYLLYSKYSESLLDAGYAAPELLFRAVKVRNELARAELRLTEPDGYRLLERLTAESLNLKHVRNRLWTDWQAPAIERVLAPIRGATALERAYFFRFLTFIANEHVMAKMGNRLKEGSGFASTWHDALQDKLQAGNIYDRLSLLSPDEHTAGRILAVALRFAETARNDMSNFRVGDIVILYPYTEGCEPDARRSMVFRCTIEAIAPDVIRLALRAPQTDKGVFLRRKDSPWAIEHDFMESAYGALYRAMHAFLVAPQERRDLLLLQREPTVNPRRELRGDYGPFNELALSVKRANDLFLIIGPPGTGKTSFGMLSTVKEELLEEGSAVLLLSYTNRAVDEICSKLLAEGIDFIRIGGRYSCADECRERLLSAVVEQSPDLRTLRQRLVEARVVVGTTAALSGCLALFSLKQFSLAVIDEASQILEPHLIGLLSAQNGGVAAIRKMVLIGDHKQLPAVVQQEEAVSRVSEPLLNDILLTDCRLSLFERLLRRYGKRPELTYMLSRQGRMHHDIALFPNEAFYGGRLKEVPLPHQMRQLPQQGEGRDAVRDLLTTRRVAFIDVPSPADSPSDKVNPSEADIIAALVAGIYEVERDRGFDPDRTVGVIVPYRNQIATVRNAIARYAAKSATDKGSGESPATDEGSGERQCLQDIIIDTVERFQGSQRKYIVYGFTVQRPYQLDFLTNNVFSDDLDGTIVDRKLNVAMTRAEEHLLMVGNTRLLARDYTFARLLDFVRARHCLYRLPAADVRPLP